jgi:hypothetical protein
MTGLVLLVVRVEDTESRKAVDYVFAHCPVRVGRSARNDIPLPRPFASAWHGVIEFDANAVRYTDLGSTNGSSIEGDRVEPRTAVEVPRRGAVTIGSYRLSFPAHGLPDARVDEGEQPAAQAMARPTFTDRPSAGSVTALMQRLARAPSEEMEKSWKRVLFPGALIGRFELIRELGRGGFGVVYEARDRQLGRLVAFKAVRPGRNSLVMYRQQRLQLEAEAVASLTHPNIVSLFDVGSCESGPYLIFELLRGETLFDRLQRGPLPLPEAVEVAIQIGWALDHAHAAGLVHRDLKPSNVFLCAGGNVKVLDFGIAEVLGGGDLRGAGTPAYMAPEQWTGQPQDFRTDVFGAATMLFETLTGQLPYRVSRERSAALDPGAQPQLDGAEIPVLLKKLLRCALDPDPSRRPAGGHEWVNGLLAVQQALEGTAEVGAKFAAKRESKPGRWPSQHLALAAALVVVVVAGGLTVWSFLR